MINHFTLFAYSVVLIIMLAEYLDIRGPVLSGDAAREAYIAHIAYNRMPKSLPSLGMNVPPNRSLARLKASQRLTFESTCLKPAEKREKRRPIVRL
jgi:hypothetical protein